MHWVQNISTIEAFLFYFRMTLTTCSRCTPSRSALAAWPCRSRPPPKARSQSESSKDRSAARINSSWPPRGCSNVWSSSPKVKKRESLSSLTGSRLDFSVLNLFLSRIKRLRVKILISLAFIVGDLFKNNVNVDYPTSFSLSYINQAFNSFTKTNIFL